MRQPVHVVGAVILREGRVLAALRGPGRHLSGHWEFPGGKVESGEGERDALVREIREELLVDVDVGDRLGEAVHAYDSVTVRLVAFACTLVRGTPTATEHAELRWVAASELDDLRWAPGDVPFLQEVRTRLA